MEGIGVILSSLRGNRTSVEAYGKGEGQTIKEISLSETELRFTFENGYRMALYDDGQSCCEHRYMHSDDDLQHHVGATLQGANIKSAPNVEDEYGEHEVAFLEVITSKGSFVVETHNEHNGYYGGFSICARELEAGANG